MHAKQKMSIFAYRRAGLAPAEVEYSSFGEIAKEELMTKDEYDYLVINERDMQVETAEKVYQIIRKF